MYEEVEKLQDQIEFEDNNIPDYLRFPNRIWAKVDRTKITE